MMYEMNHVSYDPRIYERNFSNEWINERNDNFIYERNLTLNCGNEVKWAMILAVTNAILAIA